MDMGEWNFPTDEDIADNRSAGKGDGRVFINSLRADTPQVYYFFTMPGEKASDWVNFRDLNTREGLRVGPELPTDLSFGVMVHDYKWTHNPVTGKNVIEYDNEMDPLTAGKPGQQLWQQGTRNVDKAGLIRVQWRCAVNVVDAVTGYHKILKMSLTAKEDLAKYFAVKNEDGDFDVRGRPYEILYTGEGFQWNLAIRPVRPGSNVIRDGKSVEVPARMELPEPLDVRQVLMEQREEMDAWLASLPTRSGNPVDTSTDWSKDTSDAPEFVQSGMDVFAGGNIPPNGEDQPLTEKYLAMSPARLRAMLSKANVSVDRGLTKEALATLAAEHLG